MKDIDELLKKHTGANPKRALKASFTQDIKNHLAANPKPTSRWARLKNNLPALLKRPLVAGSFAAVIVTGTAAALYAWPTVKTTLVNDTTLDSGNHVVTVDATNCNYFDSPEKAKADAHEKLYYEVKKDSKLSNDQIIAMLTGICEENVTGSVTNPLVETLSKQVQGLVTTQNSTITALGPNSLSLALDSHYQTSLYSSPTMEFTKFSKDMKVYDGSNPISFNDLQVGDHVEVVAQQHQPISQEHPNPFEGSETMPVYIIVRIKPLTGTPDVFYTHLGKDFVRTEPCTTNPNGFCRAYEFDDNTPLPKE